MDPRPQIPTGFRVTTAGPGGVRSVRVPGVLARVVALLFVLGLVTLGLIVFIPLAIIAGALFVVTLGVMWVRMKFAKARAPNGPLDGRRNVRVRQ